MATVTLLVEEMSSVLHRILMFYTVVCSLCLAIWRQFVPSVGVAVHVTEYLSL